MRPLRYSINLTPDGCCDHMAMEANETIHRFATTVLQKADALLLGRVIYQMMEAGWRATPAPGARPAWMQPFADTIGAARKHVVSSTLTAAEVDWNAELVHGDLETAVRKLKEQPGEGLYTAGLTLARRLTELRLIDEYELLVLPRFVGHGPTLFAGLPEHVDLRLIGTEEIGEDAVVLRYGLR